MNQVLPNLSQLVDCANSTGGVGLARLVFARPGCGSCVKPAGLVRFTQLFFARLGCGSCVKPAGLVGFTQPAHARPGCGSCVKSAELVGFKQLVLAGLMLTKRVFTQPGLIGGVDDKP